MKYRIFLFVAALCSLSIDKACAQEEIENHGPPYTFSTGQMCYVYADSAFARVRPSVKAGVQRKFHTGDSLIVVSTGESLTISGKEAPWCEIRYTNEGNEQKGHVWSGTLSPIALRYRDTRFLYNIKFSTKEEVRSTLDIKAVRDDSVIATVNFPVDAFQAHHSKILPPKGLKGLQCLVYFYNSGEACGVPTDEQYLGWDGNKFILFPMLVSASEAGAGYVEQKYIFPTDKGGKQSELIIRQESGEFDDDNNIKKRKVTLSHYKWDSVAKRVNKVTGHK